MGCRVPTQDPSKPRQRYVTLDAMRGVAAIAVLLRHFGHEFQVWEPDSYLAVDLFFVLSGFVLALNYDDAFASGMTTVAFMRARAIRLFPFALIGAVLGLISQFVCVPTHLSPIQSMASAALTAVAVPTPPLAEPRILFPLNTVFWSLFFELWVANIAFSVFWRWIRGPVLVFIVAMGAIGVIVYQRQFHVMDTGWGWNNALAGIPRVMFSFFIGVAIARLDKSRVYLPPAPSWMLLAVLTIILLFPFENSIGNFAKLFMIVIVFPVLVYLGAGATDGAPRFGKVLGDVSYGLYTIHVPLIVILSWIMRHTLNEFGRIGPQILYIAEISFLTFAVCVAYVLDMKFDRPLRRVLIRLTSH